MNLARVMRAGLILALGALGCYNPNIAQGGFRCGAGGTWPDDFHCASDGRCYRGDAGLDTGSTTCTSPTPAPLCTRQPAAGHPCNPTCNAGCSCGWCGVASSGSISCLTVTPGTKQLGDVCDPANASDCALGLFCRAECGTAHCYKLCDTSADCPQPDTTCTVSGGPSISLCSLPGCDPVMNTGCPTGLGCYVTGNAGYCDCPGTGAAGAKCMLAHDCMPRYSCAGSQNMTVCQKVCTA